MIVPFPRIRSTLDGREGDLRGSTLVPRGAEVRVLFDGASIEERIRPEDVVFVEGNRSFEIRAVEWTPGRWWIVAVTGRDGSYSPLAVVDRAEVELVEFVRFPRGGARYVYRSPRGAIVIDESAEGRYVSTLGSADARDVAEVEALREKERKRGGKPLERR